MWRAVVGFRPDGSLRYKEGRSRTQREAIQAKAKAEKGQTQPGEDKETVGDHLDYWLNDIAKQSTRSSTWTWYEVVVRKHLKPNIGGTPLKKLKVKQVTKLLSTLSSQGMKPGTVKKCSEVLATALDFAVSEELIETAPTANATKPQILEKEVEVFDDDEIRAILTASEGDRFEALYKLAIGTGAREGELLCLEKGDLSIEESTVRIVERSTSVRKGSF